MSLASCKFCRGLSHILAALFNSRAEFVRAWEAYRPAVNTATSVQSRWVGEWVSNVSGHHGELKCILTIVRPGELEARFLGTFRRIFRVAYAVHLNAKDIPEGFQLKGQNDLGSLAGGIYQYEGEVTVAEFKCTYRSDHDHGVFRMKRLN